MSSLPVRSRYHGHWVIENWRDRMVTILVAPLMSCSARLPVYMLMITAFVPENLRVAGSVYRGSFFCDEFAWPLVAIPVAWILKRFWFRGEPSSFVMELPSYKLPSLRVVFSGSGRGLRRLLTSRDTDFCTTILVWAAGYFPGDHTEHHQLTTQIEAWQGEEDWRNCSRFKLGNARSLAS